MKKLTKQVVKDKLTLSQKLQTTFQDLQSACETYNESPKSDDDKAKVELVIQEYNESLSNARSFCEDIASEIQEYMDNKSEKWQESDAASAYESWKEEWEQGQEWEEISFSQLVMDEEKGELDTSDLEDLGETMDGFSDEVEI